MLGMDIRGGRAQTAPSLDSIIVEYIGEWIEIMPQKKVSITNVVKIRPIPAAGELRPTRGSKKICGTWPNNMEDCDVDNLIDTMTRTTRTMTGRSTRI